MKKLLLLVGLFVSVICRGQTTNVLELVWQEPVGWQSSLYSATNLGGNWSLLSTSSPPVTVYPTQSAAFFYVQVMPANAGNGVIAYTNDPNAEGVRPSNTNQSAAAISYGGGQVFWWIVSNQQWE